MLNTVLLKVWSLLALISVLVFISVIFNGTHLDC